MSGVLKAMSDCLGEAPLQVAQIRLSEDWVTGSPGKQDGDAAHLIQPSRYCSKRVVASVNGLQRDIRDEVCDRLSPPR